jgi:hypothetical protein
VQLSAVELALQPEAFQATEELRLASGELASVIEEVGFDYRLISEKATVS